MPPGGKVQEKEQEQEVMEVQVAGVHSEIRTIVRGIGANPDLQRNVWTQDQVAEYINAFFAQGWTLFNTHAVGFEPTGAGVVFMAYILVR